MRITPLDAWIAGRIGARGGVLNRESIACRQMEKLRETVGWAKARSPFYRERLAGVSGRDVGRPEDLARFPFTTEEDVRRGSLRFLCVSQSEVTRVVTVQTSGTSGSPKRIFFDADDQERAVEFFRNGMATVAAPGDRVLILLPGDRPGSVGDLLEEGLRRLAAVAIPHGHVLEPARTLDVMEKERIDVLVGVPAQVLQLARLSGGRAAPGKAMLSTDHVPDVVSRELRRVWGCEVYTHYGMTEMCFGGGVECDAKRGYHLREEDFHVEIVDPATGCSVEEGMPGEVVFTTLLRRAMPLIRYRTGDVSRFVPGSCPCGTVLRTLARVRERLGSIRTLEAGVTLSMADLDEAIFSVDGILDFSASLDREQGRNRLRVETLAAGPDTHQALAAIREALSAVPAIRTTLSGGALVLDVHVSRARRGFVRGTAKRVLLDLRK